MQVPKEYKSYSFQVILVPLAPERQRPSVSRVKRGRTFVDALLSCQILDDGDELDVSRDISDCGREIDL